MAPGSSTARNDFFKELKPRCVAINDLAIRSQDKRASAKQLISVTEDLSDILDRQTTGDASVLDEKLADYIFFPLSNILRNQQEFPIRLTELTIKCLRILIQNGWKSKIPSELSQQLLILLTFLVGGVPGQERKDPTPEETKLEALRALTALISATNSSVSGSKSLVEAKNVPALGHTVTVILDTTTDGETVAIRLEALQALNAMFTGVKDHAALATLLPGTVSSLSRLLTPPSALKTSRKVLVQGVSVLRTVLLSVLGDMKTAKLVAKTSEPSSEKENEGQVLTAPWLKATADQIKLALASVLKLRKHDSEDVQAALERLCISLLDECHRSLAACTAILIESAMILSTEDENKSLLTSSLTTSLTDLTSIYPELTDTVKTTVYNWVTSLPRIMLSSDEDSKRQAIRNLLKGQRFMHTLRIDSSTLSNSLTASLRDSVSALMTPTKPVTHLEELPSSQIELATGSLSKTGAMRQFRPLFMDQATEKSTRAELMTLISKSGSFLHHTKLARGMLDYLRESTGTTQIASYWLTFELVKAGLEQSSDLDEFLDFGSVGESGSEHDEVLQELYSFSISTLDSTGEAEWVDWKAQSLALEVTTYAASRMGVDFRPELIDVLYPIATYLGSGIPRLREHAIIALNSIAESCGYSDVADLVIENVDYMLNSISLRLNTFDISPASTQVLRMMIKLTGPKLIPFLDDVVASIFGALDNYHGYPLFVENLFSVLAEIVSQGAESDLLLLDDESRQEVDHRKKLPETAKIEDVAQILDRRSERRRKRQNEEDYSERLGDHPEAPWKTTKNDEAQTGDDEDQEESSREVEKKSPPKTPTYNLLTRITSLTQHYLTSPAPTLRKSLLDLLAIVCPALAADEEAFLPLVNAIWPVLLSRLYDPEPFVVVSACKTLTALFASAGDFLSTRIKTEWWDNLGKWCFKAKSNATQTFRASRKPQKHQNSSKGAGGVSSLIVPIRSGSGLRATGPLQTLDLGAVPPSGGLGEFTQAAQIWEAVQGLLIGIVAYIRIDDDIFEQILDLLADSLAAASEARRALEAVNADAVWLTMYGRGQVQLRPRPEMGEMHFAEL
ncbi:HEAT repeat protein [Xylariales sp. AK1849]|nr:HEAT repeat protein [Xylariales sp. AK1849]